MEDPRTQLERMGRELKCPICLSLLNSAASLSCNHVFCNSCIVKSMKSGSNCPVCKVPYRRREVRAAPHMDNLVSIYKSMEVASGINIFVTQNEPSTKLLDKEKEVEGDPICGEQVTDGIHKGRADNQGTSRGRASRTRTKPNLELSDPVAVKPSFPTKKRVQVAKYPLPETPIQPSKSDGELVNSNSAQLKDCSVVLKDNSDINEKGPVLSPFFWLREEEDEEKSTQHTDGDGYMTPPDLPCFSDLMDSDDESPSQLSPTAVQQEKAGALDFFDSEMFEWTQRACSPELLPSPVKTQENAARDDENGQIRDSKVVGNSHVANTNEELCTENSKYENSEQGNEIVGKKQPKESSPRIINCANLTLNDKLKKRGMKARDISRKKRAKRDIDQGSGVQIDSQEDSVNVAQKKINGRSSVMQKTRKRNKKVSLATTAAESKAKNVLGVSIRAEIPDQGGKEMVSELPALGKKQGSDEELHSKKTGITCRKTNSRCSFRSKRQNTGSTEVNMLEKDSIVQNQTNEDSILQSSFLSVCMADDKKTSNLKEQPGKNSYKIDCVLNSRCKKRKKVSFSGILKDRLPDDNEEDHRNVSAGETHSTEIVQGSAGVRVLDDSSRMKKFLEKQEGALQKGQNPNKIQCAFCHSSEETEASGEMIHYNNGRPITADYNSGSKVIHSHRNCTEWAPNVYFEDDTAINLEGELARSRRIKCCCCGLKGAALGCYEKSCRKSFHVPCAKFISQCRWDTDNFVILCPLHASSKLPNENSRPQESRKKCISKKQSNTQCNEVAARNDIGRTFSWNSSQKKLVLCCSALTVGEREIISEFEKLSKVTVLKNWDSSVTHVIASTDENGAGRRTVKFLKGILEGKWILNIEWVRACMKAMKPVDEEHYEIAIDVHGIRGGPRSGRLRVLNKLAKPFDGLQFYLMGGFVSSYKGYLQDLIIAAGGTILHRKPISRDQEALSGSFIYLTFIIYSLEVPDKCDLSKKSMILNSRQSEAEDLANLTGAKAASNSWVLNSIAACKLQSYVEQ